MGGIDTNTYTGFVVHPVDDSRDLLESISQIRTLSGRILYNGTYSHSLLQCPIDRFGNTCQAIVYRNFIQMASRMKVQPVQSQLFATLHFIQKGIA